MLRTRLLAAGMTSVMLTVIIGSSAAQEGLKASQKGPAFILKTLDGSKVVKSKDIFSEKELTVLIFWDSYCPDCLKAVADCQKFYQDSETLDVGTWSINFDNEKLSEARRFVKGEGIKFPVLSDPRGVTVSKYKAKAYDFSFFIIDKRGIIRYVCYDHPPNIADLLKEKVEKLLKTRLKVSDSAPSFALKTLDESTVVQSKEAFSQRELTVLIFWNRQSKVCLDTIIECQKLYRSLEKLNVGILSVNFDKTPENTRSFVKEKGLTFPVLSDVRGVVPKSYKVEDCCFSVFIVDKKGTIKYASCESLRDIAEVIGGEVGKLRMKK